MIERSRTYRIHYYGKGKRRTLNDWENFTAKNSTEAKQIAKKRANKIKKIYGIEELQVSLKELTFVTYFEC